LPGDSMPCSFLEILARVRTEGFAHEGVALGADPDLAVALDVAHAGELAPNEVVGGGDVVDGHMLSGAVRPVNAITRRASPAPSAEILSRQRGAQRLSAAASDRS